MDTKIYNNWLKKVKQDPYALLKVPTEFVDKNMCMAMIRNSLGDTLKFVPDAIKDKELCLLAVKRHDGNLEFVPDHLKDPEICSVHRYRKTPDFFPDHFTDNDGNILSRKEMDRVWAEMQEENNGPTP